MDYQRIIVIGNTTRDAEVKKSEKGNDFLILSVATKMRSGESVFFSGFISGKLAEFAKDTKKGTLVLVDGTLDVSHYQPPEGKEAKTDLKIYVDSFRILTPKGAKDDGLVEEAQKIIKEETGQE